MLITMVGALIGTIGNKGKVQDTLANSKPPCIWVSTLAIIAINSLEYRQMYVYGIL